MKNIIAFFNNERDAQQGINSIVESGFDVLGISLILSDKVDTKKVPPKAFDENEMATKTRGSIWAIEGEDLDTEALSVPGIGEIIVAGPLLGMLDRDEEMDLDAKFDKALIDLGIPEDELEAFEERIREGQILASMEVEDESLNEIAMQFSDAGASLMNYDSTLS